MDVAQYYAGVTRFAPEFLLAIGVAVVLLVEAVSKSSSDKEGSRHGAAFLAGIFLVGALVLSLAVAGDSMTLFSGMAVMDPYVTFFRVLFCTAGLLGVALAIPSKEIGYRHNGEYYALFLALVMGMLLMASASDLVMIFIATELVSLMSYVLAGFRRRHKKGSEAALKYVIYGAAASGVMVFGFSLIYGVTGETQLSLINEQVALMAAEATRSGHQGASAATLMPIALTGGIVLSFAGFAYKIAAVPLHMWSPDVYEGAPTPFTAFLSTGPKAAGFAVLIRFFLVGFTNLEETNLLADVSTLPWILLIVVVSALTMTVGNLSAIPQTNIKRFLAYSSIAHAGYLLMGLAALSRAGAMSILIYLAFYLAMNMGAFYVAIWVRNQTGSELIENYQGLGHRAPLVAVAMAICLFSLTGLPPLAGFIGKYYLFAAVVERGMEFAPVAQCAPVLREGMSFGGQVACQLGENVFYALAVIGAVNSAISLYYYARIVRKMFLEQPKEKKPIPAGYFAFTVLVPISAFLLFFGIYWAPLEAKAREAISFEKPTRDMIRKAPAAPKPHAAIRQNEQ